MSVKKEFLEYISTIGLVFLVYVGAGYGGLLTLVTLLHPGRVSAFLGTLSTGELLGPLIMSAPMGLVIGTIIFLIRMYIRDNRY